MPNIFDTRDENKLVQNREVKPAKGAPQQPQQSLSVPQQEQSVPQQEPSVPQQEQSVQQSVPQFQMPPIPFIPPAGYGVVPSAIYGNTNDDALHRLQSQPDPNAEAMIPLLQQRTMTNSTSLGDTGVDLQTKAREWTDRSTGAVDSEWDKYVTHNKIGVNPATEFDSLGNVKQTVSEDQIRTGLNGITSKLGRSMQQVFDKNGWWNSTIQTVQGFGTMVQNVYGQLGAKIMDASDLKLDNRSDIGDAVSRYLFQGRPEMINNNKNWIERQNRLFFEVTLPVLTGKQVPEGTREKILQETPVNSISDFRDLGSGLGSTLQYYGADKENVLNKVPKGVIDTVAGGLNMSNSFIDDVLWKLSLPENLVAATVYTFADHFKAAYKASEGKSFGQQFQNYLAAASVTFRGEKEFKGNRFVEVLLGRDLGLFNRWTDEKYLSMQEPEGLKVGTLTGNYYWDLPEALGKGLRDLGLESTEDKYLHWALQGVPAFMLSMGADAPLDNLLYSASKGGKQLSEARKVIPNDVPIGTVQDLLKKSDVPKANVPKANVPKANVPETIVFPSPWEEGRSLDALKQLSERPSMVVPEVLKKSDVPSMVVPVPNTLIPSEGSLTIVKSDFSRGVKLQVPSEFPTLPITAKTVDLMPNANKSQIILSTLEPDFKPRWIPSQDLDYVYRSNEDLARQANFMQLKQDTVVFTDAEMRRYARQHPTEFTRYGKAIPQELEEFNTVANEAGQLVPIQDVYPRRLSAEQPLTADMMFNEYTKANNKLNSLNNVVTKDVEVLRSVTADIQDAQSQVVLWRDSLDSRKAYTENVHNIPAEMYSESQDAVQLGVAYVDSLKNLEDTSFNTRQLMIEMDSLEGTDEILKTHLQGLPKTSRGDMQDIQGTLGQYGKDDLVDRELTKPLVEVSTVKPNDIVTKDDLREVMGLVNWESEVDIVADTDELLETLQSFTDLEYDITHANVKNILHDFVAEHFAGNEVEGRVKQLSDTYDSWLGTKVETTTDIVPKVDVPKADVPNDFDSLFGELKESIKLPTDRVVNEFARIQPAVDFATKHPEYGITDYYDLMNRTKEFTRHLEEPEQASFIAKLYVNLLDITDTGSIPAKQKKAMTQRFVNYYIGDLAGADWDGWVETDAMLRNAGKLPDDNFYKGKHLITRTVPQSDTVLYHGTKTTSDIRTWNPQAGSGSHELGKGLYLTRNKEVAEAAASKFQYENVPVNINGLHTDPHVKVVSTVNAKGVLNLNRKATKAELREAIGGSMLSSDFKQFYSHFKKNSDGSFGQLFDSLRTWEAVKNGSVDELDVHNIQDSFYYWVASRYDMGRYVGKNGDESWIAYNPSKLTNVDVLPTLPTASDPVIHSLEAKRFLDDYTHSIMDNDVSLRNKLESTRELLGHQQTKVAEAYGEQAAKHQAELETFMRAKVDLTNQVRKDSDINPDIKKMVDEAEAELKTTDWEDLRKTNPTFRKFGNKVHKKIAKLEAKLNSGKLSPVQAKKVAHELKTVINDLADIETGMSHGKRILRAVSPKYTTDPDNLTQIQVMLNRAKVDAIDPNWYRARGSWVNRKALERARDSVQRFVSTFISDSLGGDIGKIRQQIFKLKRVGSGQFVDMLGELDMHEMFTTVKQEVHQLVESAGVKLNKGEINLMIGDLAELQSSPYIMNKSLADTNTAKLLQSQVASKYDYYINKGVPKNTLDEISEIVRQIPQAYYEAKRLATEAGLNFGDEQTLGYLPRERSKTVEFMLGGDSSKIGVGSTHDLLSSRALFKYSPEDSRTIEVVLNYTNPKWKETMGVSRFEDLVGDDGSMIAAFSHIGDDNLDMLSQMGVLKKVPFTKAESMNWIVRKHDLPFRVANDVYVKDPQRAFQIYKHGLVSKAESNAVAHGLIENSAHWTVNVDDLLNMSADEAKIYSDWIRMDKLPSSLTDTLVPAMRAKANQTLVHPMVAQELNALFHYQTSPLLLGMLGDTMQTLYKGVSSGMLASTRWVTMQLIGNSMNLVKRNINPQLFFHYSWSEIRRGFSGDPEAAINVRDILTTVKGTHGGGTFSQADLHDFAIQSGLIGMDSNVMGKGNRPVVGVSDWLSEAKNSSSEFVDYVFGKGAYYRDKGKGASLQPANQLVGIFERLNAGTNTVMDETIVRFLGHMNQGTDDAFRFALLDAVTRDSKATLNTVDGFQPMMTNLPHFNDVKKAVAWVEKNSYMFDEVQGGGEQMARWVMPFYSFRKLSIQETARWVSANPNRFASYLNLVNSTQNNFEKEDSAAWQQISGHPFYENQSPIPVKIPSTISASGQDEYYLFPLAQYMTSLGSVGDVKELLQLVGFDTINRPPSTNPANKLALPKGLSTLVDESPFIKSVIALIKPEVLLPEGMTPSVSSELKSNYAFGLNKIQYEMLKVYARPLYNAWKMAPESVTGKAPELNRETGEYTEGTPDMFTGKPPNWSPANSKSLALSIFGDNVAGQTFKTIGKLSGLAPVNFDLYLSQEVNLGLINSQKYQAQQAAKQLQKMLLRSAGGVEDPKVRQAYEEMKLLTVYLNSEAQILETWRKLKGIPHSRAVLQIKRDNLKVSDLLSESQRNQIYKENFEKYRDVFQD